MIGVLTGKEPPMKDTARRRTKIQETTTEQVVFAAMRDARATLHEAVVAAGMTVLSALLEEDRTKLCGPRYVHDRDRSALRAGYTDGELAMGGRRVRVRRPRVRGADGGELQLETWERFAEAEPKRSARRLSDGSSGRLCRAAQRPGDARRDPTGQMADHRRRRQGLRHEGLCRGMPKAKRHPARR